MPAFPEPSNSLEQLRQYPQEKFASPSQEYVAIDNTFDDDDEFDVREVLLVAPSLNTTVENMGDDDDDFGVSAVKALASISERGLDGVIDGEGSNGGYSDADNLDVETVSSTAMSETVDSSVQSNSAKLLEALEEEELFGKKSDEHQQKQHERPSFVPIAVQEDFATKSRFPLQNCSLTEVKNGGVVKLETDVLVEEKGSEIEVSTEEEVLMGKENDNEDEGLDTSIYTQAFTSSVTSPLRDSVMSPPTSLAASISAASSNSIGIGSSPASEKPSIHFILPSPLSPSDQSRVFMNANILDAPSDVDTNKDDTKATVEDYKGDAIPSQNGDIEQEGTPIAIHEQQAVGNEDLEGEEVFDAGPVIEEGHKISVIDMSVEDSRPGQSVIEMSVEDSCPGPSVIDTSVEDSCPGQKDFEKLQIIIPEVDAAATTNETPSITVQTAETASNSDSSNLRAVNSSDDCPQLRQHETPTGGLEFSTPPPLQQHEAPTTGLESSPTLMRISVCFAVIAIICVGVGAWRVRQK